MTGIFIPIEILSDLNLNLQEKLILSLIKITNNCYQTNQSIGQLVGLSKGRVSAIISSLVGKGYVELELHYKANSKQVDTRILRLKDAIQKAQEVIKKAVSKAKELKQGYSTTKTTVGTQEVDQLTFGQSQYKTSPSGYNSVYKSPYKKADKRARFNNIASHNWDFDKLELLEQDYIESKLEEEFDLEKLQSRLKNRGGSLR